MKRVLLLLPLLVLPTACSGGGDDPAKAQKAAFVKQAEAICTKANAARKDVSITSAPDAIPVAVRRLVTIASDASAELNALEPPEKDAAELDSKFLAPLRAQVQLGQAYAKRVEETAAKGDQAAVLKLLGSAPLKSDADLAFVKDYGMPQCAKAADTSTS
ncbi:MAG: hypothetical protein JWN17_1543 [Frankiales bacterium]|nr:hypothetical protein [Frankiales bacterium]